VRDGLKEHTKLEVDESQSHVIASVFDEVIDGKGLIEVVKGLNYRGIRGPRGKGWSKTSLRKMLASEVYTGTVVWGRQSKRCLPVIRTENACPAIVSRSTFDQVQKLIGQRSFTCIRPRRVSSRYLLSGLAKCGHCGKALVCHDAKSGKFAYYSCGTVLKKGAGACPARPRSAAKLERQVINEIKERILTPENLSELVKLVNEEMDVVAVQYHDDLDSLVEEISNANRRLEKLYDALETEKLGPDELAPRIHDLRHTHATLLLLAGIHPKIVSERLGHASVAITLDIYSHVLPGMQEAAAITFDTMMAKVLSISEMGHFLNRILFNNHTVLASSLRP
jgi:site-specific DNA recombinase